jgi:aminoglycoside 2'-N-acetyltransferase I
VADARVVTTEDAGEAVLAAARALCDAAFDGDFDDDDWANGLGGWHVLVEDDGELVAHVAVVERTIHVAGTPFRTGYVEAVATLPGRHGEGLGSLAMIEADEVIRRHFELGALGTGRWSFYERMGWERWQGPTFVRRGGVDARSEDDDDGVMVLRFGPSAAVDRRRPIVCEARSGDDW